MYNADELTMESGRDFIERRQAIKAVSIGEKFKITTSEGVKHGEAGDYLIFFMNGSKMIMAKADFERSYEYPANKPDKYLQTKEA